MFKKGQSGNPKGKSNPGLAGRPPSWLREKCQKLVEKDKLIQFLADVAAGRIPDHRVVDGKIVEIPASLHDRKECAELLLDRGWGKPLQMIDAPEDSVLGRMVLVRAAPSGNGHSNGNGHTELVTK